MLNRAQLKKDQDALKKPKKLKKPKDVIVDPRGQWAHPGEVTRISSGDITMQGVPYPVTGIDNTGFSQLMLPGEDYQFPGTSVTEFPHMNYGGTPKRGQIWDRLGRLHSIKSYVPFAQDGGPTYTGATSAQDSSLVRTYFNRAINRPGPSEARWLELKMAIDNGSIDLLQPEVKRQAILEFKALDEAFRQTKKQNGGSNTNNMGKSFKGRKYPFPQIQSEAEFFSRAYHNIDSPYDHGSFQFGGGARPFNTQPTMKEISSYGRPNWPYFFAQFGGGTDTSDNDVYNSTMEAMGSDYQWPMAPGAPRMPLPMINPPSYGGAYNVYESPKASYPDQAMPYMYEEDPQINIQRQRMGGSKKPCYNCGGSYKMHRGGIADINQGPEYFTNKMNKFTSGLRDTAAQATIDKMSTTSPPGYHIMPDGSMMSNAEMYNMGGGTGYPEMFPYAMPYEYKDGGNWIQKAVNPAHKGYCTPMTKKTCTPRRKAFAMTMKKHHGFHKKQDGGQMQEEKWQAIMALMQQGITDPVVIASELNTQGTYPTTPEEVQGYIEQETQGGEEEYMQEGGPMINPFAMSNISMYGQANQEAQQDANTLGGLDNFLGATANLYMQSGGSPNQKEFQTWLDEYLTANPDKFNRSTSASSVSPQYQVAPSYGQPYGAGYGYFPSNSNPYIKIKNRNYFSGVPQPQGQPQQPGINPNFPAGFQTPDGRGKIAVNYGRGFLGLGPNRLRSIDYEWGNDMSGLPADSQAYINQNPLNRRGKRTTWVGNKLRGLTKNIDEYGTPFPSKRRKEDAAWEEQYAARKANQDSNAFVEGKTQAAADAQFAKDQSMRTSPAWQESVQDKALIPWLEQTAGRLGTTPDQLVNPPQTGPTPQVEPAPAAPEKSYAELDKEYRQAVEERDRIFKEHNINKRGRHRNILGIKYGKGGSFIYGYMQDGGDPYASLAPDFNLGDPNMDPENLPGYVPPPTLNDQQIGQIFGEQQDSMSPNTVFSKGRIKFGNQIAGEDAANWGIAGMNLATNIFSQDERRNAEKNLKKQFKAENIFSSREDRDRGDYTTNYGYFRPDQQSTGRMVTGKEGGQYQEGGEYDLSEEEIQKLRRGGYQIEFI